MGSKKYYSVLFLVLCSFKFVYSNNIQVNNGLISEDNTSQGYAIIQFNLSWENSWRVESSPNNWDAAWVFVKFRIVGEEWSHALLNIIGHSSGSGTPSTVEVGLLNDKLPYHQITNPGIGVFIHRSENGVGEFNSTAVQLRWNYNTNGITEIKNIEFKIFAIEMVLVPGGNFYLGDEVSTNSFRRVDSNIPFLVSSNGSSIKVNSENDFDDSQLETLGVWLDGDDGVSRSLASPIDLNPDYPTGYRGFYCMKYEITQGQYRDFLNTLTRIQQNLRIATDISGISVSNRYVMSNSSSVYYRNSLRCDAVLPESDPVLFYCDLDSDDIGNEANDGEWIACNYLNWSDGSAYLDWSGLRPLTELEYEKACRGPIYPVADECAWGTPGLPSLAYEISDAGTANEGIALNYNNLLGNLNYFYSFTVGPLRAGIFSGHANNSGRISSGAGYSGAMELSGNLWEKCVTLGNFSGRSYSGLHGDGKLSINGAADVPLWPLEAEFGYGFRGSSWADIASSSKVSDRVSASQTDPGRNINYGFRGVRGVSPLSIGF